MNARFLFPIIALALAFAGTGCNKSGKLNTPSSSPPSAGPVELKLKWTPGEHVIQEYTMNQTMLMNIPGQPEPMKQDMTMGQKLSMTVVHAEPDGSHEVEAEFLGAHVGMQMGKMNLTYDSDKDSAAGATNPFAKVFSRIIGCKMQYYLDASNNIEHMDGIDELMDRVSDGDKSGVFKSVLNENYFKQMMDFNRYLPPNPVQPGDTWPVKLQLPMGPLGTLDANYTMTFKGWETLGKRNCARIEISGDMATESGSSSGPMGMTMTIPKGTVSGVLWFDPEFGMAVDSKLNQDMTMIMTIPKSERVPEPQTITNQLSQVIDSKVDSLE
jgi:Family of unknown function (DUF6263)